MAPGSAEPPAGDHPAAGLPAAAQAAFERLRAQFVAGLPQRWHEIQSAGTPLLKQAALHRLAGAAGSYGLPALGAAARRAEALCTANAGDALAAALAEVGRELQGARATLP